MVDSRHFLAISKKPFVGKTQMKHSFSYVATLALIVGILFSPNAISDVKLTNAADIQKLLGIVKEKLRDIPLDKIKIAVLDTGFEGYAPGDTTYLPITTTLVAEYPIEFIQKHDLNVTSAGSPLLPTSHGRMMAQTIWGALDAPANGPHFYLLNANGGVNFQRAVYYAIDQKVDIILYSQNWEHGNFDGTGLIPLIVDEAIKNKIIWINAVGHYHGFVTNVAIDAKNNNNEFIKLRDGGFDLRLSSDKDENHVDITLSWNSFPDTDTMGTDKDLDLFIMDPYGRWMDAPNEKGTKTQVTKLSVDSEGKRTNLNEIFPARERISVKLKKTKQGEYYHLYVAAKSGYFRATDKLRVTVTGKEMATVKLLDASNKEEIMDPSSHPDVIAIGSTLKYSAIGPTLDGRTKPDLTLNDEGVVTFSDATDSMVGNSFAAAEIAAAVAVHLATNARLTREEILEKLKTTVSLTTNDIGKSNSQNQQNQRTLNQRPRQVIPIFVEPPYWIDPRFRR